MNINVILENLKHSSNLRNIPEESSPDIIDLSSNDYLGIADNITLREQFISTHTAGNLIMTSSASRLLAHNQKAYSSLENILYESYHSPALLFNSGYHANIGLVSAIADHSTLIIADKLVHASIIDGIKLSGATFERFRHNDYDHLERILYYKASKYANILIIVESIYSMDGDCTDLDHIVKIKRAYPNILLYVDEAHAVGVIGPCGLGESAKQSVLPDVDILVGTFGKALASFGAFAIMSKNMKLYMLNRARSFIFSTAIPPICAEWSEMTWRYSLNADDLRNKLTTLTTKLADIIPGGKASHIRPLIIGDANKAIEASNQLLAEGYKVLPIRTPTVPPGTERLRFSLSASIQPDAIDRLKPIINRLISKR